MNPAPSNIQLSPTSIYIYIFIVIAPPATTCWNCSKGIKYCFAPWGLLLLPARASEGGKVTCLGVHMQTTPSNAFSMGINPPYLTLISHGKLSLHVVIVARVYNEERVSNAP